MFPTLEKWSKMQPSVRGGIRKTYTCGNLDRCSTIALVGWFVAYLRFLSLDITLPGPGLDLRKVRGVWPDFFAHRIHLWGGGSSCLLGGGGSSRPEASKITGDVDPELGPSSMVAPLTPEWIVGAAAGMRRRPNRPASTVILRRRFLVFMSHLANSFSVSFVYLRCVQASEDSNFLFQPSQEAQMLDVLCLEFLSGCSDIRP